MGKIDSAQDQNHDQIKFLSQGNANEYILFSFFLGEYKMFSKTLTLFCNQKFQFVSPK